MEPLNHVQLMEAFIQHRRIIGRTVEGQGYPQVELEVLDVTAHQVTIRSSWGGVMHIGPNTSWISYYAYNAQEPEPTQTSDRVKGGTGQRRSIKPPPPHADPRLWIINSSFTFPKPKPQPNPMPSHFPCITHIGFRPLLECRVITGNWISAIFARLFGTHPIDVECSIQNFGYRNKYITFELRTSHGDLLPIRLSPETAKRLAAKINEGEAR